MPKALIFYILIQFGVLFLAIISLIFWDKRYRKNHGINIPKGFVKTNEVTIDPNSGKRLTVYYNSSTGGRFYYEDASDLKLS